jgi:hypothetical protein
MKVPTLGTTVYNAIARTGTGATANVTGAGFPPSLVWAKSRTSTSYFHQLYDRLRGATKVLNSNDTQGENTDTAALTAFGMDGFSVGTGAGINQSSMTFINWCFQRAPSFFDEVCYTGTGVTFTAVTHNLQVVPELIFIKNRSSTANWTVCNASIGLVLNTTAANVGSSLGSITSTSFEVQNLTTIGASGSTYVAYLFATCAGVSKVGSYTGTAALLTVNCGFTSGARFVLIKRTDSTGGWYMYDSARGISSGNDPYLFSNNTDAEVTGTNYVDTDTTGFKVTAAAPAGLNANGGTYIFLAIA